MSRARIAVIPPDDPYFKKEIPLRFVGRAMRFRVSQSLFSSYDVDAGTRMLLRSVVERGVGASGVLDLGCGYGAIGAALKAVAPRRTVVMADRDALAVEYARQNAALNGLDGVVARGSLGYDDLAGERFDLVAMNVPGKAGDRVIRHVLLGAAGHLTAGGTAAIVAVSPLAPLVRQTLRDDPVIEITFEKATAAYLVVHYRFIGTPRDAEPANAFDAGVFDRDVARVEAGGRTLVLHTVHGLAEFDSPSFATSLLMQQLSDLSSPHVGSVAVFNPGQGYGAALIEAMARPTRLILIDRDLLALRASRRAVMSTAADAGAPLPEIEVIHTPGFATLAAPVDLIAGSVRDDDPTDAAVRDLTNAAASVTPAGHVLVACTSTAAARIVKRASSLRVMERRRKRGNVVVEIHRK